MLNSKNGIKAIILLCTFSTLLGFVGDIVSILSRKSVHESLIGKLINNIDTIINFSLINCIEPAIISVKLFRLKYPSILLFIKIISIKLCMKNRKIMYKEESNLLVLSALKDIGTIPRNFATVHTFLYIIISISGTVVN